MHWLLLRGLAREQRHWGPFPSILAERVPGAQPHSLDLPGTGTEHRRASPASVDGIVADLRERWIDLRRVHPGPWGVFAVSLGGMVAMRWCALHAGDFERAVIVNSSAADLAPPWRRMLPAAMLGIAGAALTTDIERRERTVLRWTTRLLDDPAAIARRHVTYASDRPMRRMTVLRQLLAASRFRAPARLDLPVLILVSDADELVDPACSRALAARLGAPLSVHPRGGHDLPLDDPGWVAEQVRAWLERTAPPRAA